MSENQPIITAAGPRFRKFATSAVAVQAIIVNTAERVLLLNSPSRKQGWQVVSGALEAGETVLDATIREVREELGEDIRVRPLGTVHLETFHYDSQVRFMLGSYYLFNYQGGAIAPGDDMRGSECRWWSLDELAEPGLKFHASAKLWMLKRAVSLYRLWKDETDLPLQGVI